jgi:hypothetical protein
MSKRAREYVMLVIVVTVGLVYGRLSLEWSSLELFGGMTVILAVVACIGMPWIESAPDGAWRRRPDH